MTDEQITELPNGGELPDGSGAYGCQQCRRAVAEFEYRQRKYCWLCKVKLEKRLKEMSP